MAAEKIGEDDLSYSADCLYLLRVPRASLAGLSLRDLEYALAVAEHRHFGRAAEACGVSQPGLSEGVRKLETALGLVLFERGRRITPTEAAVPLLAQAGRVLLHARTLLEMGAARSEAPFEALRLGTIPTLGPYYLPFLFRAVRERFPGLEIAVSESRTPALVTELRDGRLDCAILALPLPANDGLVLAALFDEPFHLAVPAGHALERVPTLDLRALADGGGLLLLEEGHCLRDQTVSLCRPEDGSREETGRPRRRQASSLEMLRHMIAAGEGYALLPWLAIRDGRDWEGLVTTRKLTHEAAGRTIAMAWRATDPRDRHFRELGAFLSDTAPAGTRGTRGTRVTD